MSEAGGPERPAKRYVAALPDLISPAEYDLPETRKKIRVRITGGQNGVEILADGMNDRKVEELLRRMGARVLERQLCG